MGMTENERRILDLLSRSGPLTKRDLTSRCGMGWATAVKMVARLEEEGYLRSEGFERRRNAGKSPLVYALSPSRPVAIGIDVEYGRTRAGLRNLRGESLGDIVLPTPPLRDREELVGFLARLAREMIAKAATAGIVPEGVGVGIPTHLFGSGAVRAEDVEAGLRRTLDLPVRVDNNIRCFTHAVERRESPGGSILVITVRSGIGVGIVVDGSVYRGERGRAGELGHTRVDPLGAPCRCGGHGCLETVVNREILAARAAPRTLEGLFGAAKAGDTDAGLVVAEAAGRLGSAFAQLLLVTDIRSLRLYAAFGPDGDVLLTLLRSRIEASVYPGLEFSLAYRELDEETYVAGAAFLVLRDFVD